MTENKSLAQETRKLTYEHTTTYTTTPKQRQGCIRRTALRFVGFLLKQGYERVPLNQAQDLFSHVVDRWDRLTLKAYFGVREDVSDRVIDRTAYYATGTVSIKKIHLKQRVNEKPGYFEKLGLAKFEKNGHSWFMVLNPVGVVPEFSRRMSVPTSEVSYGVRVPCVNLSLTPTHVGVESKSPLGDYAIDERTPLPPTIGRDIKSMDFSTPTQAYLEEADRTLQAQPTDQEPTLPKIRWRKELPRT